MVVLRTIVILIIILFNFNNVTVAMLIEKCSDKNYLTEESDYIVEGTVEKAESKWNKEKDTIFSHVGLKIDKYIKGDVLPEDRVKIITRSGCVEGICAAVEEEPEPTFFQKGKKVRVYLERIDGEFRLFCKFLGVEEIDLLCYQLSKNLVVES